MSITVLSTPVTTLNYGIVNTGTIVASAPNNYINNYTFCGTGLLDIDATLTIKNCIFEKSTNTSLAPGVTLYSDYCCFNFAQASLENAGGTVTGSNNLWETDPLFKGGYYGRHLHGNSPCVNTGSAVSGLASDLDGQQIGDNTSIGALEYAATNGAVPFYVRNASLGRSGDGTAYRVAYSEGGPGAWKGIANIQWGSKASSFGAGDTLYVCGTILGEELSVNTNGATNNYLNIRGDYSSTQNAKILNSPDDGIFIDGKSYINIASIDIHTPVDNGIYLFNASYCNIKNSIIATPIGIGLKISGNGASLSFSNIAISNCFHNNDGAQIQPSANATISDVYMNNITVTNASRRGVTILSNYAEISTIKNIHLVNCKVVNASQDGFEIRGVTNASLRNCVASNCQQTTTSPVFNFIGGLGYTTATNWAVASTAGNIYVRAFATSLENGGVYTDYSRIMTVATSYNMLTTKSYAVVNGSLYMKIASNPNVCGDTDVYAKICKDITIDQCRAYNSNGRGFGVTGVSSSILFKNCYSENNKNHGFRLEKSSKIKCNYCISRKASLDGFGIAIGASLCELKNCVSFDSGDEGFVVEASSCADIYNCISASNVGYGIQDNNAKRVIHSNNLSFNNTGDNWQGISKGTTDVEKDPQFIWSGEGNFHLKHTSPAIGVGTPLGIGIDYDRYVVTGIPDIGAFDQKSQGWTFETQYRDECNVVTSSKVVTSNEADNDWTASTSAIQPNHLFRLQYPTAPHYKIDSVTGSKSLILTNKYVNASQRTFKYNITRSFTACRGYANIFQGDMGVADILREQVVDKIDEDIGKVYDGVASLPKTKIINSDKYCYFSVPASGVLEFNCNGNTIAYVGTLTGSWIEV